MVTYLFQARFRGEGGLTESEANLIKVPRYR